MHKTFIRFFTIADYEEEEKWLRTQHQAGWKLLELHVPCFYVFESCEPEDVIYRMDYKNEQETDDYLQMLKDFGWDFFARSMGWLYFRKPARVAESEADGELFSDDASRVDMISHILRTRLLPLVLIFIGIIIPNLFRLSSDTSDIVALCLAVVFGVFGVIYIFLITYCGLKLRRLRNRYRS